MVNCLTFVRHFDFAVGAEIGNTINFITFTFSLGAVAIEVAV